MVRTTLVGLEWCSVDRSWCMGRNLRSRPTQLGLNRSHPTSLWRQAMKHVKSTLCDCLISLGVLLCCSSLAVHATPVPPTKCDLECRSKIGPFQETVADDPTAA